MNASWYSVPFGSRIHRKDASIGLQPRLGLTRTWRMREEDVADKPGWIVDAPGTQHISFPVSASRGIVKLAYLRTDLATMGKAHVWVSAAPGGTLSEAGAALAKAPLELDGKWDDRFSLTQVAELNNVGRGELRLHVRKVSGAKFKVEAVMSC